MLCMHVYYCYQLLQVTKKQSMCHFRVVSFNILWFVRSNCVDVYMYSIAC